MKLEKLGNICRIRNGYAFKSDKFADEGVAIIRISDIQANFVTIDKSVRTPFYPVFENYRIKKGDILIAMSGATTGKFGVYDSDEIAFQNQRVGMFEINNHQVLESQYLFHALKLVKPQIEKKAYGGGQPNISAANIGELKIPLPSISDQLHIANILSKAENLISLRKQSITLLDEFLKSTFLEMFGDFKVMSTSKLEFLGDNISYLTSGSRGWAQYYSESGAKFLRIQNIGGGIIRMDNLIHVNPPDSAEAERTRVKEGDLLISITADLGRTSVIPKDFGEAYINQHLALIRLNKNINPIYAAYFYNMPFGNNAIQKKNRAAVKAGLNFNDIKSFPISIPSMVRQTQFSQIVEKTEAIKVQYHSSLQELENLYGSLSQRAFRGELTLNKAEEQVLMAAEPEAGYQAYKKK